MNEKDIAYMEKLADRISKALYYGKLDAIGTNGSVSTGLRHDDYDFLRRVAKEARIASLEAQLAKLRGK